MRGDRGGHALDDELVQRAEHPAPRLLTVLAGDDQLGEHRVVVARDLPPLGHPRVQPYERTARFAHPRDATRRRHEVASGILRVDPALDRMPRRPRVDVDPLAQRHRDLQRHDVDTGHHLGDGVFDLQPGVHLQEEEVAVLVDDAFDRAGVHVPGLLRQGDRRLGELGAGRVGDDRGRRLLDQLLMAALHRAVPFAQEDDGPVGVGDDLRFDVVRVFHEPFQEHLGPAEVGLRFPRRPLERLFEMGAVAHQVHTFAAAAERRLHDQREPDPLGLAFRGLQVDRFGRARHDRHAGRIGRPSRRGLVAHDLDRRCGGPDEREPCLAHRLGEVRALGQESVPGMHEGGLRPAGRVDDRLDRQVGRRRRGGSDAEGLIGHLDVERIAVGVGVDRDAGDAQLPAGADDPHCDLAAVGDEDALFGGVLHWSAILSGIRKGVNTMATVDLERALLLAGLAAPVRWDEVTGSTNDTAMAMAAEGAPEWALVGAAHQTQGRGRLDRSWVDAPGDSLMVSLVLRPAIPAADAPILTLLAGAAWAEAAGEVSGLRVRCKWPNDLLVASRGDAGAAKVGGILAASALGTDGGLDWVVVGAGLNLTAPPEIAGAGELGADVDPTDLLASFLAGFRRGYTPDDAGWAERAIERWRSVADTPGRRVRARRRDGEPVEGVALGVDDRGGLIVETPTGTTTVSLGEIEHLD